MENRRDQHYLLAQFQPDEIAALDISDAQLDSYQNTFMELDLNCGGVLHMGTYVILVLYLYVPACLGTLDCICICTDGHIYRLCLVLCDACCR